MRIFGLSISLLLLGCADGTSWRKLNTTETKCLDPEYNPNEFKIVAPIYSNDNNDLIHFVLDLLNKGIN
jgi:hypothetical protein